MNDMKSEADKRIAKAMRAAKRLEDALFHARNAQDAEGAQCVHIGDAIVRMTCVMRAIESSTSANVAAAEAEYQAYRIKSSDEPIGDCPMSLTKQDLDKLTICDHCNDHERIIEPARRRWYAIDDGESFSLCDRHSDEDGMLGRQLEHSRELPKCDALAAWDAASQDERQDVVDEWMGYPDGDGPWKAGEGR